MVSLLLNNDFGCDVNVKSVSGQSFLHIACQKGYVDFIKTAIVKYKADVNARDRNKNTPLHVAALHGNEPLIFALINTFGCDINTRDYLGRSALHLACLSGNSSLISRLAKHISPLVVDDNGDTPLHTLCEHSKLYTAEADWLCIETLLKL